MALIALSYDPEAADEFNPVRCLDIITAAESLAEEVVSMYWKWLPLSRFAVDGWVRRGVSLLRAAKAMLETGYRSHSGTPCPP